MAQPPNHNAANFGVAHPIPGGTRTITYSPSKEIPRPSTLAVHKLPPTPKDHYLLEGFHPMGEPLTTHGPTAAHPTHPGGGETYVPTDWALMRWELLRSAPQTHAFPPRGGPLAKFGPTAAHPMHPGGSEIYSPTGRVPKRWEASRTPTCPHDSSPRGEPLSKFETAAAHPTHPGIIKVYPPTGQAPGRRELLGIPPHSHDFPPRG